MSKGGSDMAKSEALANRDASSARFEREIFAIVGGGPERREHVKALLRAAMRLAEDD